MYLLVPIAAGAIALLLVSVSPAGAARSHSPSACRVSARVTVVATYRSKTSARRVERITVPSRAPAACRRAVHRLSSPALGSGKQLRTGKLARRQGECFIDTGIRPNTSTIHLHGDAYTFNCTGVIDCAQTADLQEESLTTPGVWFTLVNGDTTHGCGGPHSHAVSACQVISPNDIRKYRTRGIFIIYWANGAVTGPEDEYSPHESINWACS